MLVPAQLTQTLASQWLPGDDGPHPGNVAESADAFAGTVADWFAAAQAGPFPVTTAQARRGQLQALAVPALTAQGAMPAGQMLANALLLYMTAQLYGAGVAAPPLATAAAGAMIGTAFATLPIDRQGRANLIATAIHLMAITTIVTFPGPPFSAPVF